jgi:hypothetical protein
MAGGGQRMRVHRGIGIEIMQPDDGLSDSIVAM